MKKIISGLLLCFSIFCLSCKGGYKLDSLTVHGAKKDGDNYSFFNNLDSSASLEFKAAKDGDYGLKLNLSNQQREKDLCSVKILCDDVYVCTQKISVSNNGEFSDIYINQPMHLKKGKHTLRIIVPDFGFILKGLDIIPVDDNFLSNIKHPELVNKNATDKAKALYKYLCDMQGKGILAGQQIYSNLKDVEAIEKVTGKKPAVLGIDLIDYSPSRVERGTRGNTIRRAKQWAKDGGIITCAWHWNAPKDLLDLDKPEMHWYDGFRAKATKFDYTIGLKDQNSEEYQLMIRDIDTIAVQLKALADADIPVLWRPLHEASGGWFWWGAKGADNYIQLYKMLYDRLVNYHKLNNLIWVWNGQDPKWYPGDEYVDILSYDSYPGKRVHGTLDDELSLIQSASSQSKLVAVSENGALPNVTELAKNRGIWGWFCTWNGEFVMDNSGAYSGAYTEAATIKEYYNNDYIVTLDELPKF
ncbi:MAG: glycoside hydrolase family 26 protein [Treponema sp.]|nr:glycoside hydrolase family 26 protein [Treponema sp.]